MFNHIICKFWECTKIVGHDSQLLLPLLAWHGAITLFRDVFDGIDPNLDVQVEFHDLVYNVYGLR